MMDELDKRAFAALMDCVGLITGAISGKDQMDAIVQEAGVVLDLLAERSTMPPARPH
jgi:hypothetical protein